MESLTSPGRGTLSFLREVVGIAGGLSVILGVVISLFQLSTFVDNSRRATMTLRLSALQQVKTFLEEDEQIRRRAQVFLANRLSAVTAKQNATIKQMGSGEAFYLSPEMEDFAAVHYHYEQMGALVKLGYVEFPLIFEIVAFPDAYMEAVEPVRAAIAANWKGVGRELPDLGSNIKFLKSCYEMSRRNPARPAACPNQ
jgi:hypothetical protein